MKPDAIAFSAQWVRAWNDHDIDSVLEHFDDSVVFTSPVAVELLPETAGVVRGKAALRDYWDRALAHNADLRFVVEGVYEGVDTLVIAYRNEDDGRVCEVLRFDDGLVVEGHGTYVIDASPAD